MDQFKPRHVRHDVIGEDHVPIFRRFSDRREGGRSVIDRERIEPEVRQCHSHSVGGIDFIIDNQDAGAARAVRLERPTSARRRFRANCG